MSIVSKMLFRYISVNFARGAVPKKFSVSAWGVKAEYVSYCCFVSRFIHCFNHCSRFFVTLTDNTYFNLRVTKKTRYIDSDSSFSSDDTTLNSVYELARWTLDGGVLDTYTDSNTRERR